MKKEKRISLLAKRNEELENKIISLSQELEKDKDIKDEYKNKISVFLNNFESMYMEFSDNLSQIKEMEDELDNLIKDLKKTIKDIKYRKWYKIFHKSR